MTIRAEAKRLEILQSKEGRKRRLKSKRVDINFCYTLQYDLSNYVYYRTLQIIFFDHFISILQTTGAVDNQKTSQAGNSGKKSSTV